MSGPGATPALLLAWRGVFMCATTGPRFALPLVMARIATPRTDKPMRYACLLSTPPLVAIIALLAGCGGLMPEQKIVAHATSLPPVSVAVPVTCVKKLPDPPTVVIDAPTLKQRYYQMRAAIEDLDRYYKEADIALKACAQEATK